MEDESVRIFRDAIPREWVLREYRPDYGIDLAVEVFSPLQSNISETLAEHFFVQLKSVATGTYGSLEVHARKNVTKTRKEIIQRETPEDTVELETLRFVLDTTELQTVQRMGSGGIVLLVVVDLARRAPYFVCLNDYIEKVLLPQDPDYAAKGHKTLHIPTRNRIENTPNGLVALSAYAKRTKLYSAFQVFHHQWAEFQHGPYEMTKTDYRDMLAFFTDYLVRLDVWSWREWAILSDYREMLDSVRGLLESADPLSLDNMKVYTRFWSGLSVLGRNYEEVVREWFLPTYMANLLSYA